MCLLQLELLAQKEATKWHFGAAAFLDFSTSPPTTSTNSSIDAYIGCASMADANGNLLFYTDGYTIYDATHQLMTNGQLFTKSPSYNGHDVQTALILKQPGSSSLYYVFSNMFFSAPGLYYSIVDMSLSSGLGAVSTKSVLLFTQSGNSPGQLAAVKHCNGTDYWVIGSANTSFLTSYTYKAFLLTSTGLSTQPVNTVGYQNGSSNCLHGGQMKVSPNGKKIGLSHCNNSEIWDFDNSTGIMTNSLVLKLNGPSFIQGCEFSTDGTKFYLGNGFSPQRILQYDLCAGSPSAVIASEYVIFADTSTNSLTHLYFGEMQNGPDGKIYIAGSQGQQLVTSVHVINNPNLSGASCSFSLNGQSMAHSSYYSLPNFESNLFAKPPPIQPFSFTVSNSYGCQGVQFMEPPVNSCAAVTYTLLGHQWNFGDPASGSANITNASSPTHTFSSQGTFTVKLIYYYSCGGGTDTLTQVVNVNQPCISVGSTSITCANLGSATVTSIAGTGPFSYTWLPSLQTTSIATGLSPGTYTIKVFDSGAAFTHTSTVSFISPIPLNGQLVTSSVQCNGLNTGSASFINITGGSTLQTHLWSNGSLTYTNPNLTTLSAGQWSVTLTDALTACKVQSVFVVQQPPALVVSITASSPSACAGNSISLFANAIGGSGSYLFQWHNGHATATTNVGELMAGIMIYTVVVTDNNTCTTNNTISLNYIANPLINASSSTICPLQTGTLAASGASSYTWSTGSNNSFISQSPPVSTLYTVTGESLGCTSTATAAIILKPLPILYISSTSPGCEQGSLQLYSSGGVSYQWMGPSGFVSSAQHPILTNLSLNQSGVYQVTITGANSCTSTISTPIIIHPQPTVTAAGSTVCTIQTGSLVASFLQGATYQWKGPLNYQSTQQNPVLISPAVTASGNYTVIMTNAQGCSNSTTASLLVVSPPALVSFLSSNSLCAQALNGSANSITLTSSGANSYTLNTPNHILASPDPGAPSMTLSSVPPYNPLPVPTTATLYGSNSICTVSTTLSFTVIPNPTVTVSSPTPEICAGQTFTYTNSGASSYTWNAGTPNFTLYNNGGVAAVHPSINAVFSVYGGSLGCNSASKTSTITVYPIPSIFVTPEQSKICSGSTATLTANGTATSYLWNSAPGLINYIGGTALVSPLSNQAYSVIGTANNCTNIAIASVSVLPLPQPEATVSKPLYCSNEKIILTAAGGKNYNWKGPYNVNYSGQTIVFDAFSAGPGEYILTVSDANSCTNHTVVTINIAQLPQGSLAGSKMEGCVPFCSEFHYHHPQSGANINTEWKIDGKVITSKTFTHCFTQAGENIVFGKFTDTKTNCINTETFIVKGLKAPVAAFSWLPEQPIEGMGDVVFTNNSYGEKQNKFSWFFINNDGYRSNNENTSYFFSTAGDYPVAYIVQNEAGCADTIVKYITVAPDFNFFIPNTFTPNGDERNDVFLPVLRGVRMYQLSIFDRWGEMIFESTDPLFGWNGQFRGTECKQDIYAWKVILTTEHGEKKFYQGYVSLLK